MIPYRYPFRLIVLIAVTLVGFLSTPLLAVDVASVSGTLSLDGEATDLKHISVDTFGRDSLLVLVAHDELAPPCTAFDGTALADKKRLTGVLLTIDRETLELTQGVNGVFHPQVDYFDSINSVREGLALEKTDGKAVGSFKQTLTLDDKEIVVALDLSLPLEVEEPPVRPRSVSGADSKPGKAFVELMNAILEGDVEAVKKGVAAEMKEQMDGTEVTPEMLRGAADFMFPVEIAITDTAIDGDAAVLTASGDTEGCVENERSSGRIEMLKEGGRWKTAKVSWESKSE